MTSLFSRNTKYQNACKGVYVSALSRGAPLSAEPLQVVKRPRAGTKTLTEEMPTQLSL